MKSISIKNYYKQTGSALPWTLVIILLINSIMGWYFYAQSNGSLEKTKKQKQRLQQRYTNKSDELYESWSQLQKSNDNNYQINKQLKLSKTNAEKLSIQLDKVKLNSKNITQQLSQTSQNSTLLPLCLKEKEDIRLQLSTTIDKLQTDLKVQVKILSNNKDKAKSALVNLASNCKTDIKNRINDLNSQLSKNKQKLTDNQTELQKYKVNYEERLKMSDDKQKLIIDLESIIDSNQITSDEFNSNNKVLESKIVTLSTENKKLKDEIKKIKLGNQYLENKLLRIDQKSTQEINAFKQLKEKLKSEIIAKDISIAHYKDKSARIKVGSNLMFSPGQVNISKNGTKVLDSIAELLNRFPNRKIEIIGHTDNVPVRSGSHQLILSNWELSAARSGAAIRYLQHRNKVDPQRMLLVGASQYQPIKQGNSDEIRAKNRRIEICLLPENYYVSEKIEFK
jgi:chemotaxis protein MotB